MWISSSLAQHGVIMWNDQIFDEWYVPTAFFSALNRHPVNKQTLSTQARLPPTECHRITSAPLEILKLQPEHQMGNGASKLHDEPRHHQQVSTGGGGYGGKVVKWRTAR